MSVVKQLNTYCDCLTVEEKDVNELIDLISTYTCWTQHPCETFLQGDRVEVIDLPNCVKPCDVFIFEPYYQPFEPESFTFTLVEQNGITETLTDITDYIYSSVDGNFRMELPLPNCRCKPKCECESTYKLLVNYVAGYEEIPDCLLPLFCEAIQWIQQKNECDCGNCEPCNTNYVQNGVIDNTKLTGRLQEQFLNIFTVQYFRQLSLISLCKADANLWGLVV